MRSIVALAAVVTSACTSVHARSDGGADAQAAAVDSGPAPIDAGRAEDFPPAAPLLCDPAGAGVVDFVFHVSEAFFAPYLPHGRQLLVIDRSCRFVLFTQGSDAGGALRSGTLDPGELEALNAEVLTFRWGLVDGVEQNFGTGADAWTITLRRGEAQAQCYAHCDGHAALQDLTAAGYRWVDRLWSRAVPVSGPVLVHVIDASSAAVTDPLPWSGTPLAGAAEVLVEDEADVATLRSLRTTHVSCCGPPIFLREGEAVIGVGVSDILPFDVELFTDHPGRALHW